MFYLCNFSVKCCRSWVYNYDTVSTNYSLAKKYTNDLNNKVNAIRNYTNQKDKEVGNAKTAAQKAAIKKTALAEIEKKQKDYLATRKKI